MYEWDDTEDGKHEMFVGKHCRAVIATWRTFTLENGHVSIPCTMGTGPEDVHHRAEDLVRMVDEWTDLAPEGWYVTDISPGTWEKVIDERTKVHVHVDWDGAEIDGVVTRDGRCVKIRTTGTLELGFEVAMELLHELG